MLECAKLIEMLEPIESLLQKAEIAHGHMCPGQVLGTRMALLGLRNVEINDPLGKDRKRLIVYAEIDRCATDAISLVTGCRMGKRTLKFRDWGKMAATFVDVTSERGIRVVALENSRELAKQLHPEIDDKKQQQILAYRELDDEHLFQVQRVQVNVAPLDLPGSRSDRVLCAGCGEGINFGRFEQVGEERLCMSCAHPELRYWTAE